MASGSFKTAKQGATIRGKVSFAAEAGPAIIDFSGAGLNVGKDFSVMGVPLGRALDTVTIDTAADNENYVVKVRGASFLVDSGGGATVTTIRDAILAKMTAAVQTELGFVAASSGADSIDLTAAEGGEPLDTAVDADTPANISISAQTVLGLASTILLAGKKSGSLEFRSTASITESRDIVIQG